MSEGEGTFNLEAKDSPKMRYQLLFDNARRDDDGAFDVRSWTPAQIEDWEESGFRNQYGHYNVVGIFDSMQDLNKELKRIRPDAQEL